MTRARVPVAVAERVRWRDRDTCQRCGEYTAGGSLHHRQGRGGPDPHRDANLVLLCGSGTTGCHGWVHGHPAESYGSGLMVRRLGTATCEDVPVQTFHGLIRLLPDGTTIPYSQKETA